MGLFEYSKINKYIISAETKSQMHIGGQLRDSEILINTVSGKPFIQASSIAGMLRSACESTNGKDVANVIFGYDKVPENTNANDFRSRVKVSDGVFEETSIKLEIRPNVSINKATGTVKDENGSGQKFNMTYIAAGAKLKFSLYLFDDDNDTFSKSLEKTLGIFKSNAAILGAKKSTGAGILEARSIEKATYAMKDAADRKAWNNEENDELRLKDITNEIIAYDSLIKYRILINAKTEGPLQVKGIALNAFGEGTADSENIKNGLKEYMIPGTSLKGTIRSQMEKISLLQNKNHLISEIFGYTDDNGEGGKSGNIIFSDAIFEDTEYIDLNPVRHRIHIDKFTGAVMTKALFAEKNACGNISIEIQILNRNNPDASLGLLLFALRDIMIHSVSFGNGYATGKGFLDIESIVIKSDEHITTINSDGTSSDSDELISTVLKCLKEA